MGLFGDILAPLKDIIHGLTYPVDEVKRIFGTIITITEQLIEQLISLVNEIENIFDGQKFIQIFITPFENAILTALNGIETLASLIFNYSSESFDDITQILEDPIKGVYAEIRRGIADLNSEYVDIMNKITPIPGRIVDTSLNDLNSFVDRIDNTVLLIQQEIKSMFSIVSAEGTDIKQDFVSFASNGITTISADINQTGTIAVQGTEALMQSVENRMKNESSAMDLFILIMVGLVVGGIISLYAITRINIITYLLSYYACHSSIHYFHRIVYIIYKNESNLDVPSSIIRGTYFDCCHHNLER